MQHNIKNLLVIGIGGIGTNEKKTRDIKKIRRYQATTADDRYNDK